MSFDSQGNFTPPASPIFPAQAGTTIQAEYFNAIITDIVQAINSLLLTSGQKSMSGTLNMNNNAIFGLPTAVSADQAVSYATMMARTITSGSFASLAAGSTFDTMTIFSGVNITEYRPGMTLIVRLMNVGLMNPTANRFKEIRFKVDGLTTIPLKRGPTDEPVTYDDFLGSNDTVIMVRLDFDNLVSQYFGRLIWSQQRPVNKARAQIADSASTSDGIGKYMSTGQGADSRNKTYINEAIQDMGELFSNAVRWLVGGGTGTTIQVASLYGRGLYVLEAVGGLWGTGGKYAMFAEPGGGTLVLANPIGSTHTPSAVGFGGSVQIPASCQLSIYKVF